MKLVFYRKIGETIMDIYGYETEKRYIDLNGNVVKRTPFSHPYNYDEFVVWKKEGSNNIERESAVYSDRLWEWNHEKYDKCCQEVFKDNGQQFNNRNPDAVEKFLSLYFEKEVILTAIVQGCNRSSGFSYWIFYYEESGQ